MLHDFLEILICLNEIVNVIGDMNKHLYCLKYTLKSLFLPNVQFWSFFENVTSGGAKRRADLNPASIYSSCNTGSVRCITTEYQQLRTYLIYLASQNIQKPYILRNLDPFQRRLFKGYILYLYGIQLHQNYICFFLLFFSKLEALLVRRYCDIPLRHV